MPPSSNQNPQGNSKAAKFVAANPLGPLADPFSGLNGNNNDLDDDQAQLQKEVSDAIQCRLEKAMNELREKHRTGANETDDIDRAPTGSAYRELHRKQREAALASAATQRRDDERERVMETERILNVREHLRRLNFDGDEAGGSYNNDDASAEDDEFDHLLNEDDDELTAIRNARIAQLKQQHTQRATNLSLGHGSLRTITENEFLSECTGSSKYVVVHFYNDEFERCKIMDFHLNIVAREHVEAKFLRLDASKAPFFATKFRVRTLPTLFVYEEGKEIGRLIGFDGLTSSSPSSTWNNNNNNPSKKSSNNLDEWHTGKLQEWLSKTGAIRYEKPSDEVEEEMKRMGVVMRGAVYSSHRNSGRAGVVDDDY